MMLLSLIPHAELHFLKESCLHVLVTSRISFYILSPEEGQGNFFFSGAPFFFSRVKLSEKIFVSFFSSVCETM